MQDVGVPSGADSSGSLANPGEMNTRRGNFPMKKNIVRVTLLVSSAAALLLSGGAGMGWK